MSGRHVLRKQGQFSSTLFVQSRPAKVFTVFSPSFSAARMTFLKSRHRGAGDLGIGVERVWIIAKRREADTVAGAKRIGVIRTRLREAAHVHMRDPGVACAPPCPPASTWPQCKKSPGHARK